MAQENLEIVWGDLNDYDTVYKCVEKSDLILHVAAFVSPQADYNPKKAMQVNYGSTKSDYSNQRAEKRKRGQVCVYRNGCRNRRPYAAYPLGQSRRPD